MQPIGESMPPQKPEALARAAQLNAIASEVLPDATTFSGLLKGCIDSVRQNAQPTLEFVPGLGGPQQGRTFTLAIHDAPFALTLSTREDLSARTPQAPDSFWRRDPAEFYSITNMRNGASLYFGAPEISDDPAEQVRNYAQPTFDPDLVATVFNTTGSRILPDDDPISRLLDSQSGNEPVTVAREDASAWQRLGMVTRLPESVRPDLDRVTIDLTKSQLFSLLEDAHQSSVLTSVGHARVIPDTGGSPENDGQPVEQPLHISAFKLLRDQLPKVDGLTINETIVIADDSSSTPPNGNVAPASLVAYLQELSESHADVGRDDPLRRVSSNQLKLALLHYAPSRPSWLTAQLYDLFPAEDLVYMPLDLSGHGPLTEEIVSHLAPLTEGAGGGLGFRADLSLLERARRIADPETRAAVHDGEQLLLHLPQENQERRTAFQMADVAVLLQRMDSGGYARWWSSVLESQKVNSASAGIIGKLENKEVLERIKSLRLTVPEWDALETYVKSKEYEDQGRTYTQVPAFQALRYLATGQEDVADPPKAPPTARPSSIEPSTDPFPYNDDDLFRG